MKKQLIIILIISMLIFSGCQVPKTGRAGSSSPPDSTASSTPDTTPKSTPDSTTSPSPSPSCTVEEICVEKEGSPDGIILINSDCSVTPDRGCSKQAPICTKSKLDETKRICIICQTDSDCGAKCEGFPACVDNSCTTCDFKVSGSCVEESDSTGEISNTCEYKPKTTEKGDPNWEACYVGRCYDNSYTGEMPLEAKCSVQGVSLGEGEPEDFCGETCINNEIYDLVPNDDSSWCVIDTSEEAKPPEPCNDDQPCTMYMDVGGIQKASCGCAGIGSSVTIGGQSTGQVIPSNIKCLTGKPLGRFVDSGSLGSQLDRLANLCDKCGLSGITLNFLGHADPGAQTICFPKKFPDCDTLNVDYCSTDGEAKLKKLKKCVSTVVLNGCEVGKGSEGQKLSKCLAEKLGISKENVISSTEKTSVDPTKGCGICPASESCSSPSPLPSASPPPSSPKPEPTSAPSIISSP